MFMKTTRKRNPDLSLLSKRDKYLRRKFAGYTEAEFNAQLELQGGGCGICGAVGVTRSLHVDHDHKVAAAKIYSGKRTIIETGGMAWVAESDYNDYSFLPEYGRTKSEAIRKMRGKLKRFSVRGIVCFACNRGLQKYSDNPERLKSAANYLERYYDSIK